MLAISHVLIAAVLLDLQSYLCCICQCCNWHWSVEDIKSQRSLQFRWFSTNTYLCIFALHPWRSFNQFSVHDLHLLDKVFIRFALQNMNDKVHEVDDRNARETAWHYMNFYFCELQQCRTQHEPIESINIIRGKGFFKTVGYYIFFCNLTPRKVTMTSQCQGHSCP